MKAKSGIYINFLPDDRNVPVSQGDQSILDVALRGGIEVDHTCGGHGTCGTCRVEVLEGLQNLPARSDIELEMAQDRGFSENERLACQIPPVAGLSLRIPRTPKE